jgi:hypothetical protein
MRQLIQDVEDSPVARLQHVYAGYFYDFPRLWETRQVGLLLDGAPDIPHYKRLLSPAERQVGVVSRSGETPLAH